MYLLEIIDLEALLYNNAVNYVFGSAEMIGLCTLMFFAGFVLLQQTRLDHKLLILIGATVLGSAFFSPLRLVLGFVMGVLLFLTYKKVFDR